MISVILHSGENRFKMICKNTVLPFRPFLVGDKVQNTKFEFFFLVTLFGATLSRRFARQIFTSFLSRQDLTKLKKQKNGFLFFILLTTRYDKSRQSQQKLQFCTLFLRSHKECTQKILTIETYVKLSNYLWQYLTESFSWRIWRDIGPAGSNIVPVKTKRENLFCGEVFSCFWLRSK